MKYEFYKEESSASSANALTAEEEKRIREFRDRQLGQLALNIK